MEKRLPLFLFLSFLVLFGWMMLGPHEPPKEPAPGQETPTEATPGQDTGAETVPEEASVPGPAAAPVPEPTLVASAEEELLLRVGEPGTPGYLEARLSNRGGRLSELKLGGYYTRVGLDEAERADPANWLTLLESFDMTGGPTGSLLLLTRPSSQPLAPAGLDQALWEMERLDDPAAPGVRFTYGPGTGVVFTKEIRFDPGTWHVHLRLGVRNEGYESSSRRVEFRLRPAGCVPAELNDRFYPEPRAVAIGRTGPDADWEIAYKEPRRVKPGETGTLDVPTPVAVGGMHNKYFAALLRGTDEASRETLAGASYTALAFAEPVEGQPGVIPTMDLHVSVLLPAVGDEASWDYVMYVGPKDPEVLEGDFPAHEAIVDKDLGTFFCGAGLIAAIGHGLLAVLRFFHRILGNWGVAIILLTICVRGLLFPLNRRSQTAMARYQKKMKRVQPKIEEAKKRFANDSQKQREAQAKIMQEEGAFPPLGGCAPMFLQIPVFFGLFSALRTSFDLRQAPFALWINDLSRPDRLLTMDLQVPLLITNLDLHYLNILPLLMVVMWIWQQKGMPAPADEQAARMQKMMLFMPVMFGFMLYNYAAGLSLYMITQSTLGIVEQKVIKKIWPIDDTEVEKKKKRPGCGPFSGVLENLAEKQKEQMKRMEAAKRVQKGATKAKKKRR